MRARPSSSRPKDGAKLRVGDTIQTDGTGFVEIQYTDDSFTRLDVNTTFTIVSLTDDQGNRKINGSLESGQAWNRTSALTESESFEQEGAGRVRLPSVGTAFLYECDGLGHCIATSVVDGLKYTSVDGEVQFLDPLEACTSDEVTDPDDRPTATKPSTSRWTALGRVRPAEHLPRRVEGFRPRVLVSGTIFVNDDGTGGGGSGAHPQHGAPLQAPVIDPLPVTRSACDRAV